MQMGNKKNFLCIWKFPIQRNKAKMKNLVKPHYRKIIKIIKITFMFVSSTSDNGLIYVILYQDVSMLKRET